MGNEPSKPPIFTSSTRGSLNGDPTVGKTVSRASHSYPEDEERDISEFIENLSFEKNSLKKLDLEKRMKEIIDETDVTKELRVDYPEEYVILVRSWIEVVKSITAWDDKLKFNVMIYDVEYGDMSPAIWDAWILYQKEKGV